MSDDIGGESGVSDGWGISWLVSYMFLFHSLTTPGSCNNVVCGCSLGSVFGITISKE